MFRMVVLRTLFIHLHKIFFDIFSLTDKHPIQIKWWLQGDLIPGLVCTFLCFIVQPE